MVPCYGRVAVRHRPTGANKLTVRVVTDTTTTDEVVGTDLGAESGAEGVSNGGGWVETAKLVGGY